MSTILGINTNLGPEATILAADTQMSIHDEDDKPKTKHEFSKMRSGPGYALLFAGTWNNKLEALFSYLAGDRDYASFVRFLAGRSGHKPVPGLSNIHQHISTVRSADRERVKQVLEGTAENMSPIEQAISEEWAARTRKPVHGTDATVLEVMRYLTEEKTPIEKAVEQLYLQGFNRLNRYMRRKDSDWEDAEMIIATNRPHVQLYKVDTFGNLLEAEDTGELEYVCMGSGSDIIKRYLEEGHYEKDPIFPQGVMPDEIDIPVAIKIAIKCLKVAAKDMYTNTPFELAVVTRERIRIHSAEIKREMEDAEQRAYRRVVEQYEPAPAPEAPRLRPVKRGKGNDAQLKLWTG